VHAALFGDFYFTDWHFLGFQLNRPLDAERTLSNASTAIENQTFGAGVTKKVISFVRSSCYTLYNWNKK